MKLKYRFYQTKPPISPEVPWEVIGPDPEDGGPYCIAACATEKNAQQVATALNLAASL